jgi:hypothetical protein
MPPTAAQSRRCSRKPEVRLDPRRRVVDFEDELHGRVDRLTACSAMRRSPGIISGDISGSSTGLPVGGTARPVPFGHFSVIPTIQDRLVDQARGTISPSRRGGPLRRAVLPAKLVRTDNSGVMPHTPLRGRRHTGAERRFPDVARSASPSDTEACGLRISQPMMRRRR